MFTTGYLTLGRVRGAPIRVHWSAPLGAIAFTGFSFSPGLWAGFFLLVVLHELGHAAVVRHYGHQVIAVRVHAFGGDCQWAGDPTRAEDAAIAWGGVLAQGILWLAATITLAVVGMPSSPILWALAVTFTSTNAHMILFNLLPIPPLDGHRAWPLLPILWQARKEQQEYQRARDARKRAKDREIADEKAHAAIQKELDALDAIDAIDPTDAAGTSDDDPPPMPSDVKAMLDRIADEVARERRARRDRDRDGEK
jgi:stage IV sporulation protein FB